MEWTTTTTILEGLHDYDNRGAWERFAHRFRVPIVRFARSLGLCDTDAEDVAQETLLAFAQAYRNHHYDRTKGRLSRWLFGIAYRQALSERRKRARREAKFAAGANGSQLAAVVDEPTAVQNWDLEWEQCLLENCLEQVRREVEPQTFQAFELVVRDHRTAAQAAGDLSVPIKTVYNAKHRVLKRVRQLRDQFEEID